MKYINIAIIKELIEETLKKHGIKREALCDNGAIYYRNANDGTEFDYSCNKMTCEFMCFYADTEYGACKLNQRKQNFELYIYDHNDPQKILEHLIIESPFTLEEICNALYWSFDSENIYDKPIDEYYESWELFARDSYYPCYPHRDEEEDW